MHSWPAMCWTAESRCRCTPAAPDRSPASDFRFRPAGSWQPRRKSGIAEKEAAGRYRQTEQRSRSAMQSRLSCGAHSECAGRSLDPRSRTRPGIQSTELSHRTCSRKLTATQALLCRAGAPPAEASEGGRARHPPLRRTNGRRDRRIRAEHRPTSEAAAPWRRADRRGVNRALRVCRRDKKAFHLPPRRKLLRRNARRAHGSRRFGVRIGGDYGFAPPGVSCSRECSSERVRPVLNSTRRR